MADRASVAIRIGGSLSPDHLPGFCAAIESDGAFTDWEGTAFGPERVVFDGTTIRSFSASDDDEILISAETVRGLGSYAAVLSHLAAAELEIPPFRICGSI